MDEKWAGSSKHEGGGLVAGAMLVVLGLLFLVGQFLGVDPAHFSWPFFVVLPGLGFFVAMLAGGKRAGALAIPGSIVTTVGLILFYQNSTGHWESWSYAWALIPTAVGLGLMINGSWSNMPDLYKSGRRLAGIGLVLFVLFGAFFELVLGLGGLWYARQWFWPVALIVLGVYLLVRRTVRTG